MKCYETELQALNATWYMEYDKCMKTIGDFYHSGWCQGGFDGWNCWNHTAPGQISIADCSSLTPFRGDDSEFHSDLKATKYCTLDGHWWRNEKNVEWANYTMCFVETPTFQFRLLLNVLFTIGYVISIVLCTAAFVTFTCIKPLNSAKTRVHKNLMASFILNGLCQIIWSKLQSSESILQENPIWCRILHLMSIYFLLSNFAWMFSEGCYLHCIVQFPFTSEHKIFLMVFMIGWGLPLLPVAAYTILRLICIQHSQQLSYCWTTMISDFWWCYASFALAFQASNVVFLINIIRIVISKSRHSAAPELERASSFKQIWTTVKALVILIPMFGVQYLLSCFYRPTDPKSSFTTAFQIFYVLLTSLQGLTVAVVICFLNSEVLHHLSRKWNQCKRYLHGKNDYSMTCVNNQTLSNNAVAGVHHHHQQQQQHNCRRTSVPLGTVIAAHARPLLIDANRCFEDQCAL